MQILEFVCSADILAYFFLTYVTGQLLGKRWLAVLVLIIVHLVSGLNFLSVPQSSCSLMVLIYLHFIHVCQGYITM